MGISSVIKDYFFDDQQSVALTHEHVYSILSDRRRRYTIHHLKQTGSTISVRDLAEQVAAWENQKAKEALTSQERKRVYISLYQSHLPTLDEQGLVEYNSDEGTVTLTPAAAHTRIYFEVVPGRSIPWSYYYFGLSIASLIIVGVAWAEIGLLETIPPLILAGGIAAAFLLSSILQSVSGGRMQLGDEGPPPEFDSYEDAN